MVFSKTHFESLTGVKSERPLFLAVPGSTVARVFWPAMGRGLPDPGLLWPELLYRIILASVQSYAVKGEGFAPLDLTVVSRNMPRIYSVPRIRCSHRKERNEMATSLHYVAHRSTPSSPSPLTPPYNPLMPRNAMASSSSISTSWYDEVEALLQAGNSSRGGVRVLRHCP